MNIAKAFLNQYLGEWVTVILHNGEQTKIKVTGYTLGGYSLHYIYGHDQEYLKMEFDLEKIKEIKLQGEVK